MAVVARKYLLTLSHPPLLHACVCAVASPRAGGNSIFIGTTRDSFEGKEVVRLE